MQVTVVSVKSAVRLTYREFMRNWSSCSRAVHPHGLNAGALKGRHRVTRETLRCGAIETSPAARHDSPMAGDQSLPVILPSAHGQRWDCRSCANCCRELVVHLFPEDRRKIDSQGWQERLDRPAYVRVGHAIMLNKMDDGACVFLDPQANLCRLHAEHGAEAKPLACRVFPFFLYDTPKGWRASWRFECPSISESVGKPIEQHAIWLRRLSREIPRGRRPLDEHTNLKSDLPARAGELTAITSQLKAWLNNPVHSLRARLTGASWVTGMLGRARLEDMRDSRLNELLGVLLDTATTESSAVVDTPTTARQRGMLRQIAHAHVERLSVRDLSGSPVARWMRRWRQLRDSGVMRRGRGDAPATTFAPDGVAIQRIESVRAADESRHGIAITEMIVRYLTHRIESGRAFGAGYYGWSVIDGLSALWAATATLGWLARWRAAAADRDRIEPSDVSEAVRWIDSAAGRAPALGKRAERLRLHWLAIDEGATRLVDRFGFLDEAME
jgi:lysine-N-methylase